MNLEPHAELTITLGQHPTVSVSVGVGPHPIGTVKQVQAGIEAAALDLIKPLADEELKRISDALTGGTP